MQRRNFNKIMGMSLIPLSNTISVAEDKKEKGKSVILLWLGGGISQIEFINPIPEAPIEYRSTRGFTKTHNDMIGGDFKKLASISKEITIVRSFKHKDNNHSSATSWVMTGEPNFTGTNPWPSYGSVTQRKYGTNSDTGMPLYVKTSNIEADDAAFLGGRYKGFDANLDGINDLYLDVPEYRFRNRLNILDAVDAQVKGGKFDEWTELKKQAVKVIMGSAAQAFDLSKEPMDIQTKFNMKSRVGRDTLLTIRLIEHGAKFVTLSNNGWDMHNGINAGFINKGPELDNYIFLLKTELENRGLLDSTLIVVASEFSRTPKVNSSSGRDHHAGTNSLVFIGGNYEHGRTIGKTDKTASLVDSDEFNPKDLSVTILDHLGINKSFRIVDDGSRPRELYDETATNILSS